MASCPCGSLPPVPPRRSKHIQVRQAEVSVSRCQTLRVQSVAGSQPVYYSAAAATATATALDQVSGNCVQTCVARCTVLCSVCLVAPSHQLSARRWLRSRQRALLALCPLPRPVQYIGAISFALCICLYAAIDRRSRGLTYRCTAMQHDAFGRNLNSLANRAASP